MNHTTTDDRHITQEVSKASATPQHLHWLSRVARLAAQATEMRRVLLSIDRRADMLPNECAALLGGVDDSDGWRMTVDAAGAVLDGLSDELERLALLAD